MKKKKLDLDLEIMDLNDEYLDHHEPDILTRNYSRLDVLKKQQEM